MATVPSNSEHLNRARAVVKPGYSAARAVCERNPGILNLARARLTSQLPNRLDDLCDSSSAGRMPFRQQSAACIDWKLASDEGPAFIEKAYPLAYAAETKRLIVQNLGNAEGIVDLSQINVLRTQSRRLISLLRSSHRNFR